MTEKVQAIKKSPPPEYTITGHLLRVVDPSTGNALTDTQLKAEISTVFGAVSASAGVLAGWAVLAGY